MWQGNDRICFKSLNYKTATLGRQEIRGGLSYSSGSRDGEKRECWEMNLRGSTGLVTKEII